MRTLLLNRYSATLGTNIAAVLLGFITSVFIAQSLGPIGRGELAAALLWPVLFSYLGNLGIPDATLYYGAQSDADTPSVYANAMTLAVIQSLLLIPVGIAVLPLLMPSQSAQVVDLSRLYMLSIFPALISQYSGAILRARLKLHAYNLTRLIQPIGYLCITIILWGTENLIVANVVVGHLVLSVLSVLVRLWLLTRANILHGSRVDFYKLRLMLSYGAKVHLGTLSSAANLRLDQVLITAWLPARELGIYVTAVSVTGLFLSLPQAVATVATPSIARVENNEERAHRLKTVFQTYWMVSLPAAVGLAVLLPMLIPVVYGKEFTEAIWLAEILLLATTLWGAKIVLTGAIQAMGRPWIGSKSEMVASVITAIGLFLTVPHLGILAGAIISLIAYAVGVGMMTAGLKEWGLSAAQLFRLDEPINMLLRRFRQVRT